MKKVQTIAPGKIILFGEHAVVYRRPAIAIPVNDVFAQATLETTEGERGLRIMAPDLDQDYLLAEAPLDDPLATVVRLTLAHLGRSEPVSATLSLKSTIPLGRGLGSGAAISTVIVRVLGDFFGQVLASAQVSTLVYEVEKLYHGTPSGIDNTVIAFNQPVYFIKEHPIERLQVTQPLTLVIGDTGIISPTHKVVGDLRRRWQTDPSRYESYFDEIREIVRQARHIIEHGPDVMGTLGKLMNNNQEILAAIGVSSPELELLIEVARHAGALGAKLSGAGWGGNMIALTRPEQAPLVAQALQAAEAVKVIITELPASPVGEKRD